MTEFQKQTAMDIKHHQNRVKALNKLALGYQGRKLLAESLQILADPHKGYNSSGRNCICGCRELFKSTEKEKC